MIQILSAGSNLPIELKKGDLEVLTFQAYHSVYRSILEAIYAGKDLNVIVRHKKTAALLFLMSERYGSARINFEELSIKSVFEARNNVIIPDWITEEELTQSGLLELLIPAETGTSFENHILEIFFGSFLINNDALTRVSEILAAYEEDQWMLSLEKPLIKKVYQKRLHQIAIDVDNNHGLKLLHVWFSKSPKNYIEKLSAYNLVRSYPDELGIRVLGNDYNALKKLKLNLRALPILQSVNSAAIQEIKIYLANNSSINSPSNALAKMIHETSGYLEVEFNAIIDLLKSNKYLVNPGLITTIGRKFASLMDFPHIAQQINELDLIMPVAPPQVTDENWDEGKWMDWAVNEYLPYRFWLESNAILDEQIGEFANQFSEWLIKQYGKMLYNSDLMAWRETNNFREKIGEITGPILFILVDNFNPKYYPLLREQFSTHGIFEQSLHHRISMLPSYTEVSKICIMTGNYQFIDMGYQEGLKTFWDNKTGKKSRYLANISELRQIREQDADIYFLNYIPIDTLLHTPDYQTGISHRETIHNYLKVLGQDIKAFSKRIDAEETLTIVVTSDHGSTKIPKSAANVLGDNFYNKNAIDEHHRFLIISDEELQKLPKQVNYDCYVLSKAQYSLPNNYLVARRLYRFINTNESTYIHGGLTPEEVIIPFAIYKPILITPKPIAIRLISPSKILVGNRYDIELEITNPNSYAVESIEIAIVSVNLDALSLSLDRIEPTRREIVRGSGRCFAGADLNEDKISARMTYKVNNRFYEAIAAMPVIFDSLVKSRTNFDNL